MALPIMVRLDVRYPKLLIICFGGAKYVRTAIGGHNVAVHAGGDAEEV
jgi:hypothetical protein